MMKTLSFEDYLILYFLFAGIVNSLYFLKVIQYKEDYQDLVRDLVWNSGFTDEFFYWMTFLISFIGGWWFFPKTVLKWLGIIKEEKK